MNNAKAEDNYYYDCECYDDDDYYFFFTRSTYDPSGDTKIVRRQNIILDSLE